MALENFKQLRDKRKNNILDAIERSIKTYGFDKLSIQEIAEEADISRGSFYNYFIDKNDAVYTLIQARITTFLDLFKESIMNCNGRLFDGMKQICEHVKRTLEKDVYVEIAKNFKEFVDIGIKIMQSKEFENAINELLDWLLANTEEGKSIIKDRAKMMVVLELLINLLQSVTIRTAIEANYTINDNYKTFEYKLNIIKNGIVNM